MSANFTTAECFALLDDCTASAHDPRSRLYTRHAGTLLCRSAAELPALWQQLEQALQSGKHAVAVLTYELGADLHAIAPREDLQQVSQVLLFERCERLSNAQVAAWLAARAQALHDAGAMSDKPQAGIANVRSSVDERAFMQAIAQLRAYIEAGDTYQVNYTYRLHMDTYGSPYALYARLRARQPVPFGALIMLPDARAILSLSPELFVRHEQGTITACPMKGTAQASGDAQQDAHSAQMLKTDPKSRAENVMIVDLLRNDLGRVAKLGSVRVPHLFDVQRYSSVLQMTSTLQAQLRDAVGLPELFQAIYPCGSITGAPKRRTMQIIRELEPDARGVYTGGIGWFEAPTAGQRIGDFCMSVPIRTLTLDAPVNGIRSGQLGVGAGIVYDSVAEQEYAECRLKASFLTGLPHNFALIETMHATREGGCRHVERHLQRLVSSARYFGFACHETALRDRLQQACAALPEGAHRMRLQLHADGNCIIQSALLTPLSLPVAIVLAAQTTRADDVFLRHKTTVRERYDAAWREAEAQGAFDMVFCNSQGELTEGARSNLFVKLDGHWYTPPLSAGVLPGVMRAVLLSDPTWNATERRLTLQDLKNAQAVVVCNALRGPLPATVMWERCQLNV